MAQGNFLLVRCKRCRKHGHWVFPDGGRSEEFATVGEACRLFMEAFATARVSGEHVLPALKKLQKSGIPERAVLVCTISSESEPGMDFKPNLN